MKYVVALVLALLAAPSCLPCVGKLQKIGYVPQRGYGEIFFSDFFFALCALQTVFFALELTGLALRQYVCAALLGGVGIFFTFRKKRPALKFTKRAVRTCVFCAFACFALCVFLPVYLLPVAVPVVALAAFYVVLPAELAVNAHYVTKARRKLRSLSAVKIAVTGSFGKTSVKSMIADLLGAVATPNSVNTPQGIARFVNSADLSSAKYLVFEMGARKNGDIAKLCKLVEPTVGVIVGFARQHLETFGTFGNVVKTKCELLDYLKKDDLCVLSGFDKICNTLEGVGRPRKVFCRPSDFCLESVSTNETLFSWQGTLVSLPLLGEAHFRNACLALTTCLALGSDKSELVKRCARLPQVPHRMQVIKRGDLTVIDDGYNANERGVKLCAETLSRLDGYKIVVAQGVVECGAKKREINEQAGALLGDACDLVVATGENAEYIAKGAKGRCEVILAKDRDDAVKMLPRRYEPNTVVLFQNDVPPRN